MLNYEGRGQMKKQVQIEEKHRKFGGKISYLET
jgi:hypothetical protein